MVIRRKTKAERLSEYPVPVRLSAELHASVMALVPKIGTKSAVVRLALTEGLKILQDRYGQKRSA
jgi:hypothetical protein